jgi:hypothetical protein
MIDSSLRRFAIIDSQNHFENRVKNHTFDIRRIFGMQLLTITPKNKLILLINNYYKKMERRKI